MSQSDSEKEQKWLTSSKAAYEHAKERIAEFKEKSESANQILIQLTGEAKAKA